MTRVETVYVRPPIELVQRCERPVWAGATYRDLAGYALKLKSALEECDARIVALRQWMEEARGGQ